MRPMSFAAVFPILTLTMVLLPNSARAWDGNSDCSVWRWISSQAIDAQQAGDPTSNDAQTQFVQRYERYSFSGQVEPGH
jgi:hypothetical protein